MVPPIAASANRIWPWPISNNAPAPWTEPKRTPRAARDIYDKALAPEDADRAIPDGFLGVIQYRRGQFDQSLQSYERALEIRRRILGEDHWRTALTRSNIGETLVELGRYDEALARFAEAARVIDDPSYENTTYKAFLHKGRGMALLCQRTARPGHLVVANGARTLR